MNPSSDLNLGHQLLPGRLSCDSFVSYDIRDYGDRVRKSAEYYSKFRKTRSGPIVAAASDTGGAAGAGDDGEEEEGEFGFSTTPTMRSPSTSPSSRPYYNHYRNLSPASKTQAIARGQRELMEMVSKMSESCYELSLRDIVEKQQPIVEEEKEKESEKEVKKKMEILKKKNGSVRSNNNNNNNNNNEGFLLKMVFPLSFGVNNNKKKMKIMKKKKKKSEMGSYSLKVAPRPCVIEGSDKSVDKEWWKKRFDANESGSSGSSSTSSSHSSIRSLSMNRSRHHNKKADGCLPFFSFFRNNKSNNVN